MPGGLTLEQMNKRSSFSGFDFSTVWAIEEGKSTPYLQGVKIPDEVYDIFEEYGLFEGTGTSADPYLIHNVKELKRLKYDNERRYYYKLANDIDLGSITNWEPIGTEEHPFTGNFDGNGYTIKNLRIETGTSSSLGANQGLFGFINKATISNVVLDNYNIVGGYGENIGGLVGYGAASTISKVYTNGKITLSYSRYDSANIGGIIGTLDSSDTVSSSISQCYSEGSISTASTGYTVGGIAGLTQGAYRHSVTVQNCYSSAQISAGDGVGGIIGHAATTNIYYSYAMGNLTAKGETIGGLVGSIDSASATSSYWSEELTGRATSEIGVKITASNLTKQAAYSGWNFSTIWAIDEGKSYAYLQGMKVPDAVTEKIKDNPVMEGLGTSSSPYMITNAEQLSTVKYDLKAYYKLGQDIDLSSITRWTPIGTEETPFTGNFDGDGHSIKNMKIDVGTSSNIGNNVGLFGFTNNGATIKNVTLENYKINGGYGNNVGALIGYARGTTITKVTTKGSIYLGYSRYNSENIGGIVGHVETESSMTITQCHTEGSITTSSAGYQVGGIVGLSEAAASRSVSITNSYSTMQVSGNDSIGGILGWGSRSYISYCYGTGKVTGRGENVGGILGGYDSGSVSSSFWDITTSGTEQGVLGTGKDTATMQTVSNYSGWSTTVWNLEEGKYPTLK